MCRASVTHVQVRMIASLDHSIWFHEPHAVDEWCYYDISSPKAGGARALVDVKIFTKEGRHVATIVCWLPCATLSLSPYSFRRASCERTCDGVPILVVCGVLR